MNYRGKHKKFQLGGPNIDPKVVEQMNKYMSGNNGDIQSRFAPDTRVAIANDPVKIKEFKKENTKKNYQNLRRVPNLKLYGDKELQMLADKPKDQWPEHVRNSLDNLESDEQRVMMHPDFDRNRPVSEQMELNRDNSLRTRVLRGRNTFMNSSGIPIVSDIAKMVASPGSSFANMTMDAENQYVKPGLGQGLLNLGMDVLNVAPTEAGALANRGYNVVKALPELGNFIKKDVRDFVIDPILKKTVYRKDINAVKKLWNDSRYSSEEGLKRLQSAGIDPAYVDKPKLTFDVNKNSRFRDDYIGSHYNPLENKIHIDLPQIKRINKDYNLALTPKSVYEHEFGHRLQFSRRDSENFINKYDKGSIPQGKDMIRYTPDESLNLQQGLVNLKNDNSIMHPQSWDNKEYYSYDKEAYAHMREMRQDLVDKGYAKDIYDPIAGRQIIKYMKANPKDRISSFAGINEHNVSILREAMNKLPAVAPLAIGIAASQEDKAKRAFEYGGQINMRYRPQKMQTGGKPDQRDYPDYDSWAAAMDNWTRSLPNIHRIPPIVNQEPIIGLLEQSNNQLTPDSPPALSMTNIAPVPINPDKPDLLATMQIGNRLGETGQENNSGSAVNTPKPKEDPYSTLMKIGLGVRAGTLGLGLLSGAVARGRQNQYDYKQQTALGMMNPMSSGDFQPTPYRPYAQMGGNPFAYYSQYGGNLKKLIKEFSNKAQMDMGDGQLDDQGMMAKGGTYNLPDEYAHDMLRELLHMGRMGHQNFGKGTKPMRGKMQFGGTAGQQAWQAYNDKLAQNAVNNAPKPSYNFSALLKNPNADDSMYYDMAFNGMVNKEPYIMDRYAKYEKYGIPHIGNGGNDKDWKTNMDIYNREHSDYSAYKDAIEQMNRANPSILLPQRPMSMRPKKKGGLTPNKAREILHDGTAQGHPLTDKQRRYFGAMSKGNTMNYRGHK